MEYVSYIERRRLHGQIDYLIGHAGGKPIWDMNPLSNLHLVVVEAKKEWLVEACVVHMNRKSKQK